MWTKNYSNKEYKLLCQWRIRFKVLSYTPGSVRVELVSVNDWFEMSGIGGVSEKMYWESIYHRCTN